MLEALVHELALQKNYLEGKPLQTIYFGGGTPSLLNLGEINEILSTIHKYYAVSDDLEITLEANPDDLNEEKLRDLAASPVNRLSIGIQSFFEEDLRFMNRAHSSLEAETCLKNALAYGFENLSIDLIYGTPTCSHAQWQENIERILALKIPHISCYALTVEANTALDQFIKKGKIKPLDEAHAAEQFTLLMQALKNANYAHYEISNFALADAYSKHNTAYWQGKSYLGIGPSAHSFNGTSRQWNVAHNQQYIKALKKDHLPFELELLDTKTQYNEYLMTGLRTQWGVSLKRIERWGNQASFLKTAEKYITQGSMRREGKAFMLTDAGRFLADGIAADFFEV